jgi:LysR family hydrogen peroxide-inducible transcriptional activator
MVAAGVGSTLLPVLAVQPPVPPSPGIRLLPFRGKPPSREIAMVWRRSSAMSGFLAQLAQTFRSLPAALLDPFADAREVPKTSARQRRTRT